MPCLAVYNQGSSDDNGWNIQLDSHKLVVGNGTLYENNVDTTLSIFLKGNFDGKKLGLRIKGHIDSEPDCDFFEIEYKDQDEGKLLGRVAGSFDLNQELVLIPVGDTLEIRLKFKSDPAVTMKGIAIESLRVRLIE